MRSRCTHWPGKWLKNYASQWAERPDMVISQVVALLTAFLDQDYLDPVKFKLSQIKSLCTKQKDATGTMTEIIAYMVANESESVCSGFLTSDVRTSIGVYMSELNKVLDGQASHQTKVNEAYHCHQALCHHKW